MKQAMYWIGLACAILGVFSEAVAERPLGYFIERTQPRTGQRGTTVEVTISGFAQPTPREVVFYRPGIRAVEIEPLPDLTPPIGLAHGGLIQARMRCKFEIAPDCPLGVHPFRVRSSTELSSLGTFHITPFPVVDENEKGYYENDTFATAMPVPLNISVRGSLGAGGRGDVDLYRVPAVAGKRLSVEVDHAQISDVHYGDSENDAMVRILDETGREIARNDDSMLHLQDPVLSVRLPRDGVAFIEVKRPVVTGRDTDYVVHIGDFRRPLIAFPAGGQAGHDEKIRFLGDALGDFEETIPVPETTDGFGYFGEAPSSVPLRSSPHANVFENAVPGEPSVVQFPAALNGIITREEEVDRFRFTATKGQRLQFRTFAASIGSPIDARLVLRSADSDDKPGAVVMEAEDARLTDHDIYGTVFRSGGGMREILDPSFVWECAADGDYILEVVDSSDQGGPLGVYRIEVSPPGDSLFVYLPSGETEAPGTLAVHQGSCFTKTFSLAPGQGSQFQGDMELIAHGLPKGVRLVSARIPAGASNWPLQFIADAAAEPGCAAITLEARLIDESDSVRQPESGASEPSKHSGKILRTFTQQNVPFICHPGGDGWRVVQLDHFILAVTEPLPFSIELTPSSTPLVRGGEVAIPVRIIRQPGFNGPVSFQVNWLPAGVDKGGPVIVPEGGETGELRLSAGPSARLGTWRVAVTGIDDTRNEGANNSGGFSLSSEMIDLTVSVSFLELASKLESIRRGERKKFTWTVRHNSPLPGPAQVRLLGLPTGLQVIEPLPVLTQDTEEIAFEIEATDDALLGRTSELTCAVVFRVGDQEIVQRTGSGVLRIDPRL